MCETVKVVIYTSLSVSSRSSFAKSLSLRPLGSRIGCHRMSHRRGFVNVRNLHATRVFPLIDSYPRVRSSRSRPGRFAWRRKSRGIITSRARPLAPTLVGMCRAGADDITVRGRFFRARRRGSQPAGRPGPGIARFPLTRKQNNKASRCIVIRHGAVPDILSDTAPPRSCEKWISG